MLDGYIVEALQVLGLVHQHLRLVLELLDLVVDLLERMRGGQDVLHEVCRIDHDIADAEQGMGGGRDQPKCGDRSEHKGNHSAAHGISPLVSIRSAAQWSPHASSQAGAKPSAPAAA